MSVSLSKPIFNIHVFPDYSICLIPLQSTPSRAFIVVENQLQSFISRPGGDIMASIGFFLSMSDLNAARNCCKLLHKLLSNPTIWKTWVERLKIIAPLQETSSSAVQATISQKHNKRAKTDLTVSTAAINSYSLVRDHYKKIMIDSLNVALRPTPTFTVGENYVQLLQVVDTKRDQLVQYLPGLIQNNLFAVVKIIIQSSLITVEMRGKAVLLTSISNHLPMTQLLLSKGSISQEDLGRAVVLASAAGNYSLVAALVNHGEISREDRGKAIIEAAKGGHINVLCLLMGRSVEIHKTDFINAVGAAIVNGRIDVLKALLPNGNFFDNDFRYNIIQETTISNLPTVLFFLSKTTSLQEDREYAVVCAAQIDQKLLLSALLQSWQITMDMRGSAVYEAAQQGYLEVVQLLLNGGAISQEDRGASLSIAARNGHLRVVEALLKNGSLSQKDRENAALQATERGHIQIVQFLSQT